MRKKDLLEQLRSYIEKNSELERTAAEANSELDLLREKTAELENRALRAENTAEDLSHKIDELYEELRAAEERAENKNDVLPKAEAEEPEDIHIEENTEAATVVTEDGSIDITALENIPVSKEMKYAAEAIGDIVIACASACNEFARRGGSTARELINLALGRTEVFKADCLTIASSETGFSVKKECIDRIKSDTADYFRTLTERNFE